MLVTGILAVATAQAAPKKNPFQEWLDKSKGVFKDAPDELDRRLIGLNLPKATVTPAKNRRILCFYRCGGFIHRSIPYGNHALKEIARTTGAFEVDFADDYEVFTKDRLAAYDAILFNNTTGLNPSEEQRQAILDFIKGGKGVAGTWEQGWVG